MDARPGPKNGIEFGPGIIKPEEPVQFIKTLLRYPLRKARTDINAAMRITKEAFQLQIFPVTLGEGFDHIFYQVPNRYFASPFHSLPYLALRACKTVP